ncbi:unnamed protein product [Prunus armeniaca]|uniref:Uncharacterized protein n=1 Tax=Prunus armeniaca TaxID=36596 RepID=A0A6J5VG92_PRUAR|nr:unnamed protein product [Prunus armeniaca]
MEVATSGEEGVEMGGWRFGGWGWEKKSREIGEGFERGEGWQRGEGIEGRLNGWVAVWGWEWGNNQVHHMSKCSKIVGGWKLKSPESETWMGARGERGRRRR